MNFIIDTNIISAITNKNQKIIDKIAEEIAKGNNIFINCICYYEIKRGLLKNGGDKKIKEFEAICKTMGSLYLDKKEILDESATIWAYLSSSGQIIGDADILIAGTAKVNNCTVVTNNEKHFTLIRDLHVENWLI